MEDFDSSVQLKEKLLIAGIDEIMTHGLSGLSLRRVAAACGASCAAPYKHFRNKEEFVEAIISYVEKRWELLAAQIVRTFDNPAERIAELCVANIRFKLANPLYGTGKSCSDHTINTQLNNYFQEKYPDDAEGRIFAVNALVAGTAALIDSGRLENSPETLALLRSRVLAELT
ncbi:MAG: TetR/AcrR family transcriptional regulator [Firmicutes bacterium]|nr:TetR/AcrR family transcriptional regulator [Bacillota bacterium]